MLTLNSQLIKARSARDAAQRNLDALQRFKNRARPLPAKCARRKTRCNARRRTSICSSKNKRSAIRIQKSHASKRRQPRRRPPMTGAEDALRKSSVRAPFDGVVYSLPVKQGAFVQAGELLLQEADLSPRPGPGFRRRAGCGPSASRTESGDHMGRDPWPRLDRHGEHGSFHRKAARSTEMLAKQHASSTIRICACCPTSMSA